jgi:cyclophilin family peptidyl-prolyl cis-trans isomerase
MIQKLKIALITFSLAFFFPAISSYAALEKKQEIKREKKKKKSQKLANQQKNQAAAELAVPKGDIEVVMITSLGKIRLDLFKEKDPVTVNNFLEYVKAGYYNDTIFHRVIDGFIIQGGGYDKNFNEKLITNEPIKNTSSNGIKNSTGTISMARKPDFPNSATSQFFINLTNNPYLDYSKDQEGYAVFGKVISGMDVVQKIAKQKIGQREGMYNVPFFPEEALIKSVSIVESQ